MIFYNIVANKLVIIDRVIIDDCGEIDHVDYTLNGVDFFRHYQWEAIIHCKNLEFVGWL